VVDHGIHENPFEGVTSLDRVCDVLQGIAEDRSLQFFSYLHLRGNGKTDRFIANYPLEWRKRYEDKLYIHYDPVVAVGQQSRLPFFWDNSTFIRPYRKAQQRVFYEAGDFGINYGYSIPISGRSGDLGLFSMVVRNERDLISAIRSSGHVIYLLGMQLHDHVSSLGGGGEAQLEGIVLSSRELECLKWTADGCTTEDIAERMSISAATVNYHFSKIVPKFKAMNRHHATIKAVKLGLV